MYGGSGTWPCRSIASSSGCVRLEPDDARAPLGHLLAISTSKPGAMWTTRRGGASRRDAPAPRTRPSPVARSRNTSAGAPESRVPSSRARKTRVVFRTIASPGGMSSTRSAKWRCSIVPAARSTTQQPARASPVVCAMRRDSLGSGSRAEVQVAGADSVVECRSRADSSQQIALAPQTATFEDACSVRCDRRRVPEVPVRLRRRHPAARRPLQESVLDQERLVHFFDRPRFLADGGGDRAEPTGPPSNFSMIARRMRASMSSRPNWSTSSICSACVRDRRA